jgi:hypothetical protein
MIFLFIYFHVVDIGEYLQIPALYGKNLYLSSFLSFFFFYKQIIPWNVMLLRTDVYIKKNTTNTIILCFQTLMHVILLFVKTVINIIPYLLRLPLPLPDAELFVKGEASILKIYLQAI